MAQRFCNCKDCKKMKRRGLVLGSRNMGFWIRGFHGQIEYYYGNVRAYVPHPKFAKGRARKERNFNINNLF